MTARNILMAAAGNAARPQPTFVSSSVASGGGTSATVTAPSGIQNGDLLVALVFVTGGGASTVVTPPTGFNVQSRQNSSATVFCFATKVAASESGNYTFAVSGTSSNTSAIVLVYRNATSVNTVGALAIAASNTVAAASITPTYNGTLVAAYVRNGSGSVTATTPPAGMTLRGSYLTANPVFEVYDQAAQTATATGTKSIAFNGPGTPETAGILLQVTNEPSVAPEFVASASQQNTSTGASLVINKPSGTVEGDLMVAFMMGGSTATQTWTAPAGWTEVLDQGAKPNTAIAYKVAGASEGASYTFTASASNNTQTGCILTYRYAAYDTIGTLVTAANPLVLTSISPTLSQSILLAFGAREAASITIGTPTSMTARVTDSDASLGSYKVADQIVAKGPTGTRSMTTGSTTSVAGIMLAIKPTRSL